MEPTQFSQLPPNLSHPPPMHIPPPNMAHPPPSHMGAPLGPPMGGGYTPRFEQRGYNARPYGFRPFQPNFPRGPMGPMTLEDFDGKRLRKSVMRKTVDYNSAIITELENRIWQRDFRDRRALQPDVMYYPDLMPPPSYSDNAINCVTTRFVKTATNKMRCPIFCMAWTPEGRRLVTGASSGEFTLWNGLTFNFETILQAHDSPVRTMVWSHNDSWMVTGDHAGYVKYWQSNMNNVKMFQAHKEALRGISFSPTDNKFVTCSDDGTLRIWDFLRHHEERILRGHGADVKCVHWHPQKGLIISGSKDNQQPIKLWDPKTGQSLATLHAHKSTVMDLKWNENGNWLITASRDHLLKLFDLRNLGQEVQTFRGHKKEASSVAWHPVHEGLFCSGGSDGSIMFWHVGADKEVGAIEQAHDSIVWTLAWHPLGHILCSGSNDHTSKFWTRNRPGDQMRDKYNLNTLPAGISGVDELDIDEPSVIPGMGPEDKVEFTIGVDTTAAIPGLDLDVTLNADDKSKNKKVPYSKPIPRNFQANWNETAEEENTAAKDLNDVLSKIVSGVPGAVPLNELDPSAIIMYGKMVPIKAGSKLREIITEGPEAIQKFIASGAVEELQDVMPQGDDRDYEDDYDDDDDDDKSTEATTGVNTTKHHHQHHLNSILSSRSFMNLAQQFDASAGQNNNNNGSQNQSQDKSGSGDQQRPRKSRFSDLDESSQQMKDHDMRQPPPMFPSRSYQTQDLDMRNAPGTAGNVSGLLGMDLDLRNLGNRNRGDGDGNKRDSDMDLRNSSDSSMDGKRDAADNRNPQQHLGGSGMGMLQNPRDTDFRPQHRFEPPWNQNNGNAGGGTNFPQPQNDFSPGNRMPNLGNPNFPPPNIGNFRPLGFPPNFRPDGPPPPGMPPFRPPNMDQWNGGMNMNFRGRPPGPFGPMRGGPPGPMRGPPPRGFPGPPPNRGAWRGGPPGNVGPGGGPVRGRNVF